MTFLRALGIFAVGGVFGWLAERAVAASPRYSQAFPGIPWLPVYATGAVGVALAAPHLAPYPWWARWFVYGAGLSGIEYVGCAMDRSLGPPTWCYAKDGQCQGLEGCVSVPHAALWGLLGLGAECVIRSLDAAPASAPPRRPNLRLRRGRRSPLARARRMR